MIKNCGDQKQNLMQFKNIHVQMLSYIASNWHQSSMLLMMSLREANQVMIQIFFQMQSALKAETMAQEATSSCPS